MWTTVSAIEHKLAKDQPLTYEDRTFLLGFIMFSKEFVDYVREEKGLPKWTA